MSYFLGDARNVLTHILNDIMIPQILKLLKAFNSNASPWQLSAGLAFGSILGLTPILSLHNLFFVFIALIINLNIGLMILSFGFFSGVAYIFDPVFHQIGYSLLTSDGLKSFWITVFSCPISLVANLNNTIVLGSLAISIPLTLPMFFAFNVLLEKYRNALNEFLGKFKLLKFIKVLGAYDTLAGNNK